MPANPTLARLLAFLLGSACLASGADAPPARHRQPVALAGSPDGGWIFAANRRSGTVSVVDLAAGRVAAESEVGRGLSDLAILPGGRHLLAVDREGDSLVLLRFEGRTITVESRLAVAPDPVALAVSPDGPVGVVASTSPRRLSVVGWAAGGEGLIAPKLVRSIDLPFAPRLMAWAGPKLVVADALGGRLAVVDPGSGRVESSRSIPGHNIRGLAVSPDGRSLVVAHQVLSRLARSSFEDIHWGTLLNNHLRILRLDAVLAPGEDADLLRGSRLIELGETGHGTGDPGAVAFDRQGRLAVALSGVGELAHGPITSVHLRRVGVGQGPSAVLPGLDGRLVYVADAFDDTLSVVEVAAGKRSATIGLGPRPEPGPVDRGERLFRDARLSHDGWMSCQSCHTDGQTNGLLADTLGDGGFGAPKRIPSLLGVGSTGPWTWTGSVDRLEEQVRKSIETSMRGRTPTAGQVDDLTAYLRSLPPPRPTAPAAADEAQARGREVFRSRKCAGCHAGPEATEAARFDVGLVDEVGHREFNPPSLRGVSDRAPYLHDGRAPALPDVFLRHRHPRQSGWSYHEVEDLVAYLRTL
jgi:YVTN family beta-propeller protein